MNDVFLKQVTVTPVSKSRRRWLKGVEYVHIQFLFFSNLRLNMYKWKRGSCKHVINNLALQHLMTWPRYSVVIGESRGELNLSFSVARIRVRLVYDYYEDHTNTNQQTDCSTEWRRILVKRNLMTYVNIFEFLEEWFEQTRWTTRYRRKFSCGMKWVHSWGLHILKDLWCFMRKLTTWCPGVCRRQNCFVLDPGVSIGRWNRGWTCLKRQYGCER